MLTTKSAALLLAIAAAPLAAGHFVLQVPESIGYVDKDEDKGPCGGFDINTRQPLVEWPISGHPVQVISTHTKSLWTIQAALLSDPTNFRLLVPKIDQSGLGTFCEPVIPGIAEWEGKDAVVQMTQEAVDGKLYQCAAVRFVNKPAAAAPATCKNSTNLVAVYVGGSSSSPPAATGSGGGNLTGTGPTPSPTVGPKGAASVLGQSFYGVVGSVVAGLLTAQFLL